MMKSAVTLLAAAAAAICLVPSASAQNVGGRYQVIGKNFNGSTYSGTAEITVTSNNTCRIVWVTGGTTSRGICMRHTNAFSAGYVLNGKVGLVIYEMKSDGSLDGLWTVADENGVGAERLVPIR
jgi:hypothetical protein